MTFTFISIFLSCIQFADDTTLYISHSSLDYIKFCLEHDLGVLQDWFLANKLTLNIGKSVLILFGNHNYKLSVQLGDEIIPQSRFTKFLGLWIDENLNWHEHTIETMLLKLKSNTESTQEVAGISCRTMLYESYTLHRFTATSVMA